MESRRGQLLVASSRLSDPNFHETVVLIVKDDEEDGSLGLVLNRPLDVRVADALGEQVEAADDVDEPLYQGGPCEGPLCVLHDNPAGGGAEVCEGVRFSMDKEEIQWLMANHHGPIQYFAGYSGWGLGQLQAEIDEGAWALTPASAEHVFEQQGNWAKITRWLTLGRSIDIGQIPDDPNVN